MCSKVDHYSAFLRRMSDSNKSVEKEEEKVVGESSPENREISSAKETPAAEKEEETEKATVSERNESGKKIEEDDDGFKTPTTADHKIPAIKECPPAPQKPRPPSKLKRKASPPGSCRSIQFDSSYSPEIESIFRPTSNDDNAEEQKMKKARKDTDEG